MSSSRGSNPANSSMDSHNDSDWCDPSSGECPSNGNPPNTSNAPSPAPHVGSTFGTSFNHDYSSFPGLDNLSPPLSHFGTHPQAPQWTGTNHPLFDSEAIASLFALCPRESSSSQEPTTLTPSQPSLNQLSGSTVGSISTAPHITYVPFQDHSTSPPFPYTMQSKISPLYSAYPEDPRRPRFGSYSGPTQYSSHYLRPPPNPYAPFNVGHNHRSRTETQDGRPRFASLPVGPSQHVPQFNLDYQGHQSSINHLTVQPFSVPRTASLSEGSSSSSSRSTLSPATSTASLTNPPSPSSTTVQGQTFIWRLNPEDPGFTCDCKHVHEVIKKKRHLESCPRNPHKPTIECPYCPEIYTGGSRRSTLSGHIRRAHKDKAHLLKKRKN